MSKHCKHCNVSDQPKGHSDVCPKNVTFDAPDGSTVKAYIGVNAKSTKFGWGYRCLSEHVLAGRTLTCHQVFTSRKLFRAHVTGKSAEGFKWLSVDECRERGLSLKDVYIDWDSYTRKQDLEWKPAVNSASTCRETSAQVPNVLTMTAMSPTQELDVLADEYPTGSKERVRGDSVASSRNSESLESGPSGNAESGPEALESVERRHSAPGNTARDTERGAQLAQTDVYNDKARVNDLEVHLADCEERGQLLTHPVLDRYGIVKHRVLNCYLCVKHEMIVPITDIIKHVSDHARIVPVPTLDTWKRWALALGIDTTRAYPAYPAQEVPAYEGLAAPVEGRVCTCCLKGYKDWHSLNTHAGSFHRDDLNRPTNDTAPYSLLQRYTPHPACHSYFRVFRPSTRSREPEIAAYVKKSFEDLKLKPEITPEDLDIRHEDPWNQWTGWYELTHGRDYRKLASIVELPNPSEKYGQLRFALEKLFKHAESLMAQTHEMALCKLKTPETGKGLNHKPFKPFQKGTTIDTYTQFGFRTILTMARTLVNSGDTEDDVAGRSDSRMHDFDEDTDEETSGGEEERPSRDAGARTQAGNAAGAGRKAAVKPYDGYRLRLPEDVRALVLKVEDVCSAATFDMDDAVKACHDLLVGVWTRKWLPTADNPYPDPTLHTAALISLKPTGELLPPESCTGIFAQGMALVRFVLLRHSHLVAQGKEGIHAELVMQEIDSLEPYYTEDHPTTFRSLRRYQHFASALSLQHNNMPRMTWIVPGEHMSYEGTDIRWQHMRELSATLQDKSVEGFNKCRLHSTLYFEHGQLKDDNTNRTPWHSFVSDNRNREYFREDPPLLRFILENESIRGDWVHIGPNGEYMWHHDTIIRYLKDYAEWQTALATAADLLTCGPARGTEITGMLAVNTRSAQRNVYMVGPNLVLRRRYHKMQARTGFDKMIPEPLDAVTALLVIQDQCFIRPFVRFLVGNIWRKNVRVQHVYATSMFVNLGRMMTTDDLTAYMKRITVDIMGEAFGINALRHQSIAWKRFREPGMTKLLNGGETIATLQTGHTRSTDLGYAVSDMFFEGAEEDIYSRYLLCATHYQIDLGLVPGNLATRLDLCTRDKFDESWRPSALDAAGISDAAVTAMGERISDSIETRVLTKVEEMIKASEKRTLEAIRSMLSGSFESVSATALSADARLAAAALPAMAPGVHSPDTTLVNTVPAPRLELNNDRPPASARITQEMKSATDVHMWPQDNAGDIMDLDMRELTNKPTPASASYDTSAAATTSCNAQNTSLALTAVGGSTLPPDQTTPLPASTSSHAQSQFHTDVRDLYAGSAAGVQHPSQIPCADVERAASTRIQLSSVRVSNATSPENTRSAETRCSRTGASSQPCEGHHPQQAVVAPPPPLQPPREHDPGPVPSATTTEDLSRADLALAKVPPQEVERRALKMLQYLVAKEGGRDVDPRDADGVTWRSEAQRESILTCLRYKTDGLFVLATGSGKTYIPIVPALIEENSLTIIAVPLNAIFDTTFEMLPAFNAMRCQPWGPDDNEITPGARVVLISYDRACHQEFKTALLRACQTQGYYRVRLGLDECHMSGTDGEWRKVLTLIKELRALVPMQVVAYTGTLPHSLEASVKSKLGLAAGDGTVTVRTTTNRPELSFHVAPPVQSVRSAVVTIAKMWEDMKSLPYFDKTKHRAIIFVQTGADGRTAKEELSRMGVECELFCGSTAGGGRSLTSEERAAILDRWIMEGDKAPFLLATPALGAGFHYPWVLAVFHVRPGDGALAQLQQWTRAGRSGETSWCIMLPFKNDEHWWKRREPDVKGKNVLMEIVFGKFKKCIRKSLFDFVDGPGQGQRCLDQPFNSKCTVCVKGSFTLEGSMPDVHPKNAPAPAIVSTTTSRKRAGTLSVYEEHADRKAPGPSVFRAQQDVVKTSRSGRMRQEMDLWKDVRQAADYFATVCPLCLMDCPGSVSTHHSAYEQCPHITSDYGSWMALKDGIHYEKNSQAAYYCYHCHTPLVESMGHSKAREDIVRCKPRHAIVLPVAWFARNSPKWMDGLARKFPDIERHESYEEWLVQKADKKPWRNITEVLLWAERQTSAAARNA